MKVNKPNNILNTFISESWEEVDRLKAIMLELPNKCQPMLQELIDSYLICLGQLEGKTSQVINAEPAENVDIATFSSSQLAKNNSSTELYNKATKTENSNYEQDIANLDVIDTDATPVSTNDVNLEDNGLFDEFPAPDMSEGPIDKPAFMSMSNFLRADNNSVTPQNTFQKWDQIVPKKTDIIKDVMIDPDSVICDFDDIPVGVALTDADLYDENGRLKI